MDGARAEGGAGVVKCERCKRAPVSRTVTAHPIVALLCEACYAEWIGYRAQKQIEHHLGRFRDVMRGAAWRPVDPFKNS